MGNYHLIQMHLLFTVRNDNVLITVQEQTQLFEYS
jgi:hypothetical protein